MLDETQYEVISKIVERANGNNLIHFSKFSLTMDLELATEAFNLDLDGMIEASDLDFGHDILGIQNHINRETKKFENCFVPRFARN